MTKKRSRRKKEKRSDDKPVDGGFAPPITRMLTERAIAAGSDYFKDNFIRIMRNSVTLRYEPEFADFYLDPRQTLEAAAHRFPRLRRQMARVLRRGKEPTTTIYDDYRIIVLDDMDTPQLRQQLRRRLDRCTNRLKRSRDADRLEMALFLTVLLGDTANKLVDGKKPLPLGAYGLVTAIYEDSFDRAMEEIPTARDIIGDEFYRLWCAKFRQDDMDAITTAVEQVSAFTELAERLETDPALALAWERQESYLIEDLQTHTAAGLRFKPGFFTPDEVALAMDKMEQRYLSKPWSPSRYFTLLALLNFTNCVRETLDEIMSPRRVDEIVEGLNSVGQHCLETDDERLRSLAPHVQAVIHHLQRVRLPSQNQVLLTMYVLSFPTSEDDVDTLSPRWRRLFKRLRKSRFARGLGIETEMETEG